MTDTLNEVDNSQLRTSTSVLLSTEQIGIKPNPKKPKRRLITFDVQSSANSNAKTSPSPKGLRAGARPPKTSSSTISGSFSSNYEKRVCKKCVKLLRMSDQSLKFTEKRLQEKQSQNPGSHKTATIEEFDLTPTLGGSLRSVKSTSSRPEDPKSWPKLFLDPVLPGIFQLTRHNFVPFLKQSDTTTVLFYDASDTSSKETTDKFSKIAEKKHRENLAFVMVDCAEESNLCKSLKVKDLPLLKVFTRGYDVISGQDVQTIPQKA